MSLLWLTWCDLWRVSSTTPEPTVNNPISYDELVQFQQSLRQSVCSASSSYFTRISDTYALFKSHHIEIWRHYHDLSHISQCLTLFNLHRSAFNVPEIVLLSLFFHDIIYNPRSPTNEEDSAILATAILKSIQQHLTQQPPSQSSTNQVTIADFPFLTDRNIQYVHEFILATKTHKIPQQYIALASQSHSHESNDQHLTTVPPTAASSLPNSTPTILTPQQAIDDCAWVLDIDMSILAANPDDFEKYEQGIRSEYIFVPLPIYKEKRGEIMRGFASTRIYIGEVMHRQFEQIAIANLRAIDVETYHDPKDSQLLIQRLPPVKQ